MGPHQFLFDCDSDGTWDAVRNAPEPVAQASCPLNSSATLWAWDKGTDETFQRQIRVAP